MKYLYQLARKQKFDPTHQSRVVRMQTRMGARKELYFKSLRAIEKFMEPKLIKNFEDDFFSYEILGINSIENNLFLIERNHDCMIIDSKSAITFSQNSILI